MALVSEMLGGEEGRVAVVVVVGRGSLKGGLVAAAA